MEWWHLFLEWITDGSKHFWLASASGLAAAWLGFLSMSIMYCAALFIRWIALRPKGVAFSILICLLLLALSAALLSHWALDYLSTLYNTPLGPPLQLNPGVDTG